MAVPNNATSKIWGYFHLIGDDYHDAICNVCTKHISRGKAELKKHKMGNKGMDGHLKTHKEVYARYLEEKVEAEAQAATKLIDPKDESARGSTRIYSSLLGLS